MRTLLKETCYSLNDRFGWTILCKCWILTFSLQYMQLTGWNENLLKDKIYGHTVWDKMLDQMHFTRWRKVKMISLTWLLHEGFQLKPAASFLCWHWPCYIGSHGNKTCCHPPWWSHSTPWWHTVCWLLQCSSSPSETWQWLVRVASDKWVW